MVVQNVPNGSYNITTIDVPGATFTQATGINASGEVVGVFFDSKGLHGFVYDRGGIRTIDVPGTTFTPAVGINDRGQVVGNFSDNKGLHGFVYDKGTIRTIDVPGATFTQAAGINASGEVVGIFSDSKGNHGFVDDKDTITTIDGLEAPPPVQPVKSNDKPAASSPVDELCKLAEASARVAETGDKMPKGLRATLTRGLREAAKERVPAPKPRTLQLTHQDAEQ